MIERTDGPLTPYDPNRVMVIRHRQRPQAYCIEPEFKEKYGELICVNCGESFHGHYREPEIMKQACDNQAEARRKAVNPTIYEHRRMQMNDGLIILVLVIAILFAIWGARYAFNHPEADMPTAADAQTWKTP